MYAREENQSQATGEGNMKGFIRNLTAFGLALSFGVAPMAAMAQAAGDTAKPATTTVAPKKDPASVTPTAPSTPKATQSDKSTVPAKPAVDSKHKPAG